jgi:predicted RNase H-like nuclease (RuvC/YqgF family)
MQLKNLSRDLDELKKTKVKMMRQMKEEIAKNKKREAERERQISQLKKESRKRDIQLKNMESEKRQRDLVLKRKQEEVEIICNNFESFLFFTRSYYTLASYSMLEKHCDKIRVIYLLCLGETTSSAAQANLW